MCKKHIDQKMWNWWSRDRNRSCRLVDKIDIVGRMIVRTDTTREAKIGQWIVQSIKNNIGYTVSEMEPFKHNHSMGTTLLNIQNNQEIAMGCWDSK